VAKKIEAFNYKDKAAQLERVVADLQNPDIDIDEATKLHAAGLKLIQELETYLQKAEMEVRKHVSGGA
jgi:exodeoxyribonuclease VII small subunit